MKIHKEGHKTLRNLIIIYILIGVITLFDEKFLYYATPIFLCLFIPSLYFFRIPKRKFKRKDGVIYAPCDGKVVVIEETDETEYYKEKRLQVSIFMSPLNIHNNLYPISGIVKYIKYHPGTFLFAWHPKASSKNERSSLVIENNKISILCRQVAGALARRIITYSKVAENINVADELGFIKFGSRVDLFLPIGSKLQINLGEKVNGGQSIIAKY